MFVFWNLPVVRLRIKRIEAADIPICIKALIIYNNNIWIIQVQGRTTLYSI